MFSRRHYQSELGPIEVFPRMPRLELRHLAQIACFIDHKWSKSLKMNESGVHDSAWKVSTGNSSNNGTSREKKYYAFCCPSVSTFLPQSLFFVSPRENKNVFDLSSKKISRVLLLTMHNFSVLSLYHMRSLLNESRKTSFSFQLTLFQ